MSELATPAAAQAAKPVTSRALPSCRERTPLAACSVCQRSNRERYSSSGDAF